MALGLVGPFATAGSRQRRIGIRHWCCRHARVTPCPGCPRSEASRCQVCVESLKVAPCEENALPGLLVGTPMPLSSHVWLGCPGVPVLAAKTPDESPIKRGSDCKACDKVFHGLLLCTNSCIHHIESASFLDAASLTIQKHIGTWHFASFEKTAARDPALAAARLERFESGVLWYVPWYNRGATSAVPTAVIGAS